MKIEQEWITKLGNRIERQRYASQPALLRELIRQIQLDALEHAAMLLTANADSPTKGFEAVHKLIVQLKSK